MLTAHGMLMSIMIDSTDPLTELRIRLQRLHRDNGEPSTREIARRTHKAISHTTVHGVLRCSRSPRWGQLELVVEALAGNVDEFRQLWVADRDAADRAMSVDGAPAAIARVPDPRFHPMGSPLYGHTEVVGVLAFSPGGDMLASAGADRTVRLWDPEAGQPLGMLEVPATEPSGEVYALAFHPDGDLLAAGGAGRRVRVWDPDTGEQVSTIAVNERVNDLAFRPGSRVLACAAEDGLHLSDAHTGAIQWELSDDRATAVAFHPNGQILASGNAGGAVFLWKADTGERIGAPLRADSPGRVMALAFHPEGHVLAVVQHFKVWLWDTRTGVQVGEPLGGLTGPGWSIAWRPDGRLLATASEDPGVQLWDPSTGSQIGSALTYSPQACIAVAWHPAGHLLATAGYGEDIQLWEPADQSERPAHSPVLSRLRRLRAHNHALRQQIDAARDRTLNLFLSTFGHWSEPRLITDDGAVALAFGGEDGVLLAVADTANSIRLWNASDRTLVGGPLTGHTGRITGLALDPHRTLASVSDDGTLRVWDIDHEFQVRDVTVTGHPGLITAVAFHPRDARRLATANHDGEILSWWRPYGSTTFSLQPRVTKLVTGPECTVKALAYQPDGPILAAASADSSVLMWDQDFRQVAELSAADRIGHASAMAFHPDAHYLAIADADGTVWLWNLDDDELRIVRRDKDNRIAALALRADGFLLAAVDQKGAIKLLPVAPD